MARFSVVLPVRNGIPYVKDCVKSILDQDYSDFELIVLDNCSTDGTADWLDGLGDKRIRLFRSEASLSIVESWARIRHVAKGEFMTMIGHDDLLDPGFLSAIDLQIQAHPQAGLYQTSGRLIDSTGAVKRGCKPVPPREDVAGYLKARFAFQRDVSGTGFVMRSRDYDRIGGIPHFERLFFADDALWLSLMKGSYKAADPAELCSIRIHPASESASLPSQWGSLLLGINQFMEFVEAAAAKDPALGAVVAEGQDDFLVEYHTNFYIFALIDASTRGRKMSLDAVRQITDSLDRWAPSRKGEVPSSPKVKLIGGLNASPLRWSVPLLWRTYKRLAG